MACPHNQAQIDAKRAQIQMKQQQITSLNNNINEVNSIMQKHQAFGDKIKCVMDNLDGNTIQAGVAYDNGKMTECFAKTNQTIKDCEDIIRISENKKEQLNSEIQQLHTEINGLQGDCGTCAAEKAAAAANSELTGYRY